VEVGATQAEAVLSIGRAAGWRRAESRQDLDGRARLCLFGDPLGPI
jgi:methylase of polypeptide subunit release factors